MKQLIFIAVLLIIGISCYAQESQESYTLLMLEFENRTGLENPLLDAFNETVAFVLSRQTGPVHVGLVPAADRKALLMRAARMHPDKSSLEQGLLAAEWIDADALVAGSYTKQGKQWSLESQVYHRREGIKTRQEMWMAIPDIEINSVSLKAGLNRFLVATAFGAYSFTFTFRITDHDGNAIPGLKYVSAKEVLASR